jgi:hypothetical protein
LDLGLIFPGNYAFAFGRSLLIIFAAVKTTRYFEEQVLRKRPYIQREWCERVVAHPLRREIQADGRIRHWGVVAEIGGRALRVITLADGETIHNAFPDRDFKLP